MNVKVDVKKEEAWRRVLAIEVPEDDVAKEYDRVAQKVAKRVRLPGFRKGKVPVSLVRKSFRKELEQEFLETVMPKAFGQALDETGLDPVTEPKFDDVSFGEERPFSFTVGFDCRPDVEVKDYRGLAAVKEVPEVTDEHVESMMEDFRKGRATLEDVERPAIRGDVLLLDYQAVDGDGKPIPNRNVKGYTLEMGADQVVDDFENALTGVEAGAVREAEVPYPEEYPDKMLAGSTARYKIKVRAVREKRFPELTDELVNEHTELATVEELRERVRKDLGEQADRAGVDRLERILLDQVVEANPFDPPEALVASLLDDLVGRQKLEAHQKGEDPESLDAALIHEQNREGAAREVRRMLVLDAIAKREEIEVDAKELRERVALMAALRRTSPKKVIEELGGDRFLRRIRREMRDKKVLAFLVENAEISQKSVPVRAGESREAGS
jgi:trigger factor